MPDLKKVINGLDCCLEGLCEPCEYSSSKAPGGCKDELMCDALALLKKQEPIRPLIANDMYFCGNCKYAISRTANYCPKCGKKVEWYD